MTMKLTAWVVLIFFLAMTSCQSYSQLPPRSAYGFARHGNAATSTSTDFEPMDEQKEKDPAGQILVVIVGIALAVGSAIAIPVLLKK